MPYILDNNIDLSSIATTFSPAVASGLTTFALLGKSLQASMYNYANPTVPLLTNSSGISLPLITSGVSGAAVGAGNQSAQIILPDIPSTGSETIFAVFSVNPSNWTSFVAEPLGVWNGTSAGLGQAFEFSAQNTTSGISCLCGYIDGTSGSPTSFNKGVFVHSGALGTTTAEQAIISTPQLYKFKFDIPNLLVTWQNVTQASIIGAPASTTQTLVITAGSSRPVITGKINMLGTIQAPLNISVTHHIYAHYNRATTTIEDSLIYSQLQTIMTMRGFTI